MDIEAERAFCSNFVCCGIPLRDLHALFDHPKTSHQDPPYGQVTVPLAFIWARKQRGIGLQGSALLGSIPYGRQRRRRVHAPQTTQRLRPPSPSMAACAAASVYVNVSAYAPPPRARPHHACTRAAPLTGPLYRDAGPGLSLGAYGGGYMYAPRAREGC
ncbi:hypothetical protein GGX14DRAFT_574621 [Mycena pura]|uniref:Uncharacterized protein n=1 Tax=Mycena pura TaxID=153505 RepID=A0AAD6Y4Y0_9AGAR|nr:hypothetical protein GGX14DRAFT_574621 [Mycena pura]